MKRTCRIAYRTEVQFRHPERRGTSLIEMLVVITLLSVVMGVMGTLLHGVWRVEQAIDEHRVTLDTLQRLATQFRSDVHSAASAAIRIGGEPGAVNPEPQSPDASNVPADEFAVINGGTDSTASQTFTLTLPDHKHIDYQVAVGTVSRIVRDGEQVVARESYALPADAVVKWEITSSDFNRRQSSWQASLLVSYPRSNSLPEFSKRRELRIDATAGLQVPEIRLTQNKP